jgi:hypothetical protein
MVNKEVLIETLTRINSILTKNGNSGQANFVGSLKVRLSEEDSSGFVRDFCSASMWGGSGAVWEVGGFESEEMERSFRRCMIQLVEQTRQMGITYRHAKHIADLFRELPH